MSIEAMALVLHHSRHSETDKLILLGIANHEGDDGAWPTIATLARYANRSEDAVRRALRRLEASGELVTDRQGGGQSDPRRRANRYRIALRCPPECDGTTAHRVDSDPAPTRVQPDPGPAPVPLWPRADASPDPAPTRGTTITEPSPEPSRAADTFGDEFESTWTVYPRKIGKQKAKRAYIARRRAGAPAPQLHAATQNYADSREGESERYTMHGATFYGPDEPWRDWLQRRPGAGDNGQSSPADVARRAERARGF